MPTIGLNLWAAAAVLWTAMPLSVTRAQPADGTAEGRHALEQIVARLIHRAIPLEYEKQKDWGSTKEIPVGVRVEGKPFHYHFHRRTKAVNHGVWKHYKVRIVDPQQDLAVTVANLRPLGGGRVGCTLQVDAKIDVWARAKTYEYGVHLLAVELEADTHVRLVIEGELGVKLHATDGLSGVRVEPAAKTSRMVLENFHIRRVSNANGPLVRELSGSARRMLEEELDGPALTAKINRAMEKNRDRLAFSASELVAGAWRPLAELAQSPAQQPVVNSPAAASTE
jgi:hypothetical protein